jgi:hypothetical protein
LVSSALTRVDLDSGAIQSVALPAAPWRTAPGDELSASLGYALASDANGERVFAARHALGALGKNAWFGAASVDVLLTSSDRPLAPRAPSALPKLRSALAEQLISGADTDFSGSSLTPFTQPRALVVRRSTDTLLVAGEGDDRIAELDALAPDPTQATIHEYQVGTGYHPTFHVARQGAAPAGLALSQDEKSLYVYSRATNDVSLVQLLEPEAPDSRGRSPVAHLELAPDPLGPFGATGRKLFHSATDRTISGGLACAGCHPEGRDDGFVWREVTFTTEDGENKNFVGSARNIPPEAHTSGSARRTPLLAERVGGAGPYGWHAESPTLVDRELQGFRLHRWGGQPEHEQQTVDTAANAIADYLRRGLVPPPSVPIPSSGPIAEQIAEGRRIFNSRETGCADCHLAATGYSIWQAMPLAVLAPPTGFDPDPDQNFKVPSLRHLAGRAPYLHDGSAASLEELIRINANRMGKTSHLSSTEQSALVAFLQTL